MKRFLGIFAASAALFAAIGCGRGGSSNIAVIDGDPITSDEFVQYLKTKNSVRVVTNEGVIQATVWQDQPNGRSIGETLAFQAFVDLVRRKLLLRMAKEEDVFPSDQQVVKEIEFRKQLNPNFIQQLNTRGLTLERIKAELTVDLATENLLTKGITIRDEELNKFIKDNKLDKEPADADLFWIFVANDAIKQQVDKELAGGASFAIVAGKYSQAPNAKEAGARYTLRMLAQDQRLEFVRAPAERTKAGQSTNWIQGGQGWSKIYVEKKVPERNIKLDNTKREAVRREMAKLQGRRAKDIEKRLADKLFDVEKRIQVQPKDLDEMWRLEMERAKRNRNLAVPTSAGSGTAGGLGGSTSPK